MPDMPPSNLPVYELEPAILASLRGGGRVIVQAPGTPDEIAAQLAPDRLLRGSPPSANRAP